MSHFQVAYTEFVISYRRWILFATLVLVMVLGSGVRHLHFNDDYRVYFGKDNPQLLAYQQLEHTYNKSDNLVLVVSHSGGIFQREVLGALRELTEASWQLPYSSRVDSVTNFQYTYAEDDDLIVEDLITDPQLFSDQELQGRKIAAQAEPRLIQKLLSTDARVTAVNVTFQPPDDVSNVASIIVPAARQLVERFKVQYPELEFRLSGELMLEMAFRESGVKDATTLVPLMYLSIVLMIWFLVRSFMAVLGVVLMVSFSVISALGIAGWMGLELTTASAPAPTMIMTLAVADSIHILISMFGFMRNGQKKIEALVNSLTINLTPIIITSVTTAVGFMTLNFNDVPPFRDFGNITAAGVMFALLYSATFLPAYIAAVPISAGSGSVGRPSQWMTALGNFVVSRPYRTLLPMLVLSVVLLALIPLNKIDNQFVKFFNEELQFRADTDYMMENLSGITLVEYSIAGRGDNVVAEPVFQQQLKAFTQWLRQHPDVVHVNSISDTLQKLNMNMHGDNPDWYTVPESRELASQYLLLYELSLPYGLDLNNEINLDKSATRVVVTMADITSGEVLKFNKEASQWLHNNAPQLSGYGSGASLMFAEIFKRSTISMIWGTLIGIVVISVILIVVLRSFRCGLLSLVANLLPAGMAFGVWSVLVGEVNMAVSIVLPMTLGIVVDDSVHFLSKYLRARRENGYNAQEAVRYAFSSVGLALVITSAALVVGFGILSCSTFRLNADTSQLTAITIVLALVVDFLMLPALLILMDKEPDNGSIMAEEK